jgi:hypothetical protein
MGKISGGFGANPRDTGLMAMRARFGDGGNSSARVESTLQKDCPDLFKRARRLLIQWGATISADDLSLELGKTIYPAKLLHKDDGYRKLVREFSDNARQFWRCNRDYIVSIHITWRSVLVS